MKAMIMAGGEGTRLRPITCACPKPMVRVCGKPVIDYTIKLLKKHGIYDAGVTLQYLPEKIKDSFGDGSTTGISLKYWIENKPLGTAGSIKQAVEYLNETFIVLSGDGLTDCDLTKAVEFHKSHNALATLVLARVACPLEYGVVITDEDGKVRRFVEKPGWNEVFSDTVNTGIYILEPEVLKDIPDETAYDFGRELFPSMVARKLPVYGYVMDGYWCDIGDITAYRKANIDMLSGKCKGFDEDFCSNLIEDGAIVSPHAILVEPYRICQGAMISDGAQIGPNTVIGAGAIVKSMASIKQSVVWEDAVIEHQAQLRACIVGSRAQVGEEAYMFEDSVLGDEATLGLRSGLLSGVMIWPNKHISEGIRVSENLVWGDMREGLFSANIATSQSPQNIALLAQAYASATKVKEVALMHEAGNEAAAMYAAVQAGLASQGVRVVGCGEGSVAALRGVQASIMAEGSAFIWRDGMEVFDCEGIPLERNLQRKIEGLNQRNDFTRAFSHGTGQIEPIHSPEIVYCASCEKNLLAGADNIKAVIFVGNEFQMRIAKRAFEKWGYTPRFEWADDYNLELETGEIGFYIDDRGETLRVLDDKGMFTELEQQLLISITMLENGVKELCLPMSATRSIDKWAGQYGANARYVKSERTHWMQQVLLSCATDKKQFQIQFDALHAAAFIMKLLVKSNKQLREIISSVPQTYRKHKTIACERIDRGRVMRTLAQMETSADLTDGVRIQLEKGWAWVAASDERAECRVLAESEDPDDAQEICDNYARLVEQTINSKLN